MNDKTLPVHFVSKIVVAVVVPPSDQRRQMQNQHYVIESKKYHQPSNGDNVCREPIRHNQHVWRPQWSSAISMQTKYPPLTSMLIRPIHLFKRRIIENTNRLTFVGWKKQKKKKKKTENSESDRSFSDQLWKDVHQQLPCHRQTIHSKLSQSSVHSMATIWYELGTHICIQWINSKQAILNSIRFSCNKTKKPNLGVCVCVLYGLWPMRWANVRHSRPIFEWRTFKYWLPRFNCYPFVTLACIWLAVVGLMVSHF